MFFITTLSFVYVIFVLGILVFKYVSVWNYFKTSKNCTIDGWLLQKINLNVD